MLGFLIGVAAFEGLVFCLGVLAMVIEGLRMRRQRRRIAEVRSHLVRFAAEDGQVPMPAAIRGLRWVHLGRLLASLASQLTGRDRDRLVDLARQSGLYDKVEHWCTSRRWRRRLQAAQLRRVFGRVDELTLTLLRDPYPLVRAEAARTVATSPEPWSCKQLIGLLDDDSLACRNAARDALSRAGGNAAEPVLEALAARTPHRSLIVLLDIAAHLSNPHVASAVAPWLDDENPAVRAAAATALGSIGGPAARNALLGVVDDESVHVRVAVVEALGRIGVAEDARLLVRALDADAWQLREASGLALTRLGAVGRMYLRRAARGAPGIATDTAKWILDRQGVSEKQVVAAGIEAG